MALKESQTREGYLALWSAMTIRPGRGVAIQNAVTKILAGREQYAAVEDATKVPWWVAALLHMRESSCDFSTYLGNGEPLSRVTRLVPKGRGPFTTWHDGAVDALTLQGYSGLEGWDLPAALHRMEAFNGWGYFYKGVNSPYLWAGTSQYTAGKFVADGKWSATVIDHQLGCAAVLRALIDGGYVTLDAPQTVDVPLKIGARGGDVRKLQAALAKLGYAAGLADGVYGPATRRAVLAFQDEHELTGAPGEWQSAYWAILDAAKPIISPERAAATVKDVAAVSQHMSLLVLLQRILAFFGLGALGAGGATTFPDTVNAFDSAIAPFKTVLSIAEGHGWLLALLAAGVLLVLVRVLIADHLAAFQTGQVQK